MSQKDSSARIGFDDIAWGVGYIDVPVYGGGTRRVKRINFKDIPYDETKTLAQQMDLIDSLLKTNNFTEVVKQKDAIANINIHLAQLVGLTKVAPEKYGDISDALPTLMELSEHINEIHAIVESAKRIGDHERAVKALVCRMQRDCERTSKVSSAMLQDTHNRIEKAVDKVESMDKELTKFATESLAEVLKGNELSRKFATYNWVLNAKRPCEKLDFHIDDRLGQIVLNVPVAMNVADCDKCEMDKTLNEVLMRTIVETGQSVFPANNATSVDRVFVHKGKPNTEAIAILESDGMIHVYKEDPVLKSRVPYTGLKANDSLEFYISKDPATASGGVTVLDTWGDASVDKVISSHLLNILNNWVKSLIALSGMPELSNNLGTFLQEDDEVIIPDNSTVKEAFQAIEKYLDKIPKTYLQLPDTISDYTGQALKMMRVNLAEDAVEAVKLTALLVNYDDTVTNFGLAAADQNVQKVIEKMKAMLDGMPDQKFVATIAARDALLPGLPPQTMVHVDDATADPTVNKNWAKYQYLGGTWVKYQSWDDLHRYINLTPTKLLDRTHKDWGALNGEEFMKTLDILQLNEALLLDEATFASTTPIPSTAEVQGKLNLYKDAGSNLAPRNKFLVYNGVDTMAGAKAKAVYYVDRAGIVIEVSSKNQTMYFAPDNLVNPAIAGEPTTAEIEAHTTPKSIHSAIVYYNGKDAQGTDRHKYAYWVDGEGKATLIDTWVVDNLNKYISALGILNQGIHVVPKADLTVGLRAGTLMQYNPTTHKIDTYVHTAVDPAVFDVIAPDGTVITANTSTVPVTQYWDGAVKTLPDNNDAVMHSFFYGIDGKVRLLMGNVKYPTFGAGTRLYGKELVDVPAILADNVFVGGLLVRKDTTTTNHVTKAMTINASRLGEVRVSGATGEDGAGGLRGKPVADTAAIAALDAQDFELREDNSTGNVFRFKLGAVPSGIGFADAKGTGAWIYQRIEPMLMETTVVGTPLMSLNKYLDVAKYPLTHTSFLVPNADVKVEVTNPKKMRVYLNGEMTPALRDINEYDLLSTDIVFVASPSANLLHVYVTRTRTKPPKVLLHGGSLPRTSMGQRVTSGVRIVTFADKAPGSTINVYSGQFTLPVGVYRVSAHVGATGMNTVEYGRFKLIDITNNRQLQDSPNVQVVGGNDSMTAQAGRGNYEYAFSKGIDIIIRVNAKIDIALWIYETWGQWEFDPNSSGVAINQLPEETVIDASMQIAVPFNITATGAATTVNGGQPLQKAFEDTGVIAVQIDVPVGKLLTTVKDGATDVVISDPKTGVVHITRTTGQGDLVLTVGAFAAVPPTIGDLISYTGHGLYDNENTTGAHLPFTADANARGLTLSADGKEFIALVDMLIDVTLLDGVFTQNTGGAVYLEYVALAGKPRPFREDSNDWRVLPMPNTKGHWKAHSFDWQNFKLLAGQSFTIGVYGANNSSGLDGTNFSALHIKGIKI